MPAMKPSKRTHGGGAAIRHSPPYQDEQIWLLNGVQAQA
jgi:hypothetical protein